MYCISINYKYADVNIRKKFAFSKNTQKLFVSDLIKSGNISQCVILCTCNRTEIYFCGNDNSVEYVKKILSIYSGVDKDYFIFYTKSFCGDNALNHLFRVACGIESMIIGEDEILGQIKTAYKSAVKDNTVSYEMNVIFQYAIACAKKIKTNTKLSSSSVSTATLTVNEVSAFRKSSEELLNVLLIGATGKIGQIIFKNLLSQKNINVIITRREVNNDIKIPSDSDVTVIDYKERYEYISKSDCIISATSSPHYTITFSEITDFINDDKNRLFIDLAVPPDIERNIENYINVKLIDIDYFEKLAEKNNTVKLYSVKKAENIIKNEMESLKKEMLFREFLQIMPDIKKSFENKNIEDILYKMKSDLNYESFADIISFMQNYKG